MSWPSATATCAATSEQERQETCTRLTNGNPLLIKWTVGQLGRGHVPHHGRGVRPSCGPRRQATTRWNTSSATLLETFTESETAVLAALTHFTQPAKVKWIADLAGMAEPAALTALEDLADRALLVSAEPRRRLLAAAAGRGLPAPQSAPRPSPRPGTADRPRLCAGAGERLQTMSASPCWKPSGRGCRRPAAVCAGRKRPPAEALCAALHIFLDFPGAGTSGSPQAIRPRKRRWPRTIFTTPAGGRMRRDWYILSRAGLRGAGLRRALRRPFGQAAQAGARREQLPSTYAAGVDVLDEKQRFGRERGLSGGAHLVPDGYLESYEVLVGLTDLAGVERRQSDHVAAERTCREGLQIANRLGTLRGIAVFTTRLADLALDSQDWAGAEARAREALELAESLGRLEVTGVNCCQLAKALGAAG